MKKIAFFIHFLLLYKGLLAQDMVLYDPVSSRPFNSGKYSEIKGTPFLNNDWTPGVVTTSAGKYKMSGLKLDAYEYTLFFNKGDEPFEFRDEVISFVLMPVASDSSTWLYYKKGFSGSGLERRQFVQVLAEGKVSLFKSSVKMMSENNEINRGVVKTFKTVTRYFIMKDNTVSLLKTNSKDVLSALSDKENQVKAYMLENKLSAKNDVELARIFRYYNSL